MGAELRPPERPRHSGRLPASEAWLGWPPKGPARPLGIFVPIRKRLPLPFRCNPGLAGRQNLCRFEKGAPTSSSVVSQGPDKYFSLHRPEGLCTTTELCHLSQESRHRQYINKWTWLCPQIFLFIKTGSGPDVTHGLLFANSCCRGM